MYCPKPLLQCQCLIFNSKITFQCSGEDIHNGDFETAYRSLSNLVFDLLILNNTRISALTTTQNGLNDKAKFKEIWIINNQRLESLNDASFYWSRKVTDKLLIDNNPLIRNYGWKDLVRSMINLTELNITNNAISKFDSDMFNQNGQSKLRILNLRNNQIEGIGDTRIPSLPHIESMLFDGNQIDYIKTSAFELVKSDASLITISLSNNKINGKSIEKFAFNIPNENQFYLNLENNKFEDISESSFESLKDFIMKNPKNVINFANNNLTCQDKILRDLMKKQIGKKQIIGIDCPEINEQTKTLFG